MVARAPGSPGRADPSWGVSPGRPMPIVSSRALAARALTARALAPRLARVALLAASVAATVAAPARAQQTIINAPSVDQTPEGRVFALHETQWRDWGGESFWQTTHFLTYGVTARVEAALTVYNVGTPLKRYAAVGLGWKTAQPLDFLPAAARRWSPVLGAGQMVPLSLRGRGAGLWSYAQGSVRVPRLQTRLTAGVSNGPANLFGTHTTHLVTSYEQPLHALGHRLGGRVGHVVEHMALLGEWWSGRHEFAEFVPGVNYHHKALVLILGYKLGNAPGTRGDGVIVEVGRTF